MTLFLKISCQKSRDKFANWTTYLLNTLLSIGHTKAISSAFFSSQTGNKAVTVAYDNKIRIFDTENLNQNTMKPYKSITHNNQTGRWLTSKYRKKNSWNWFHRKIREIDFTQKFGKYVLYILFSFNFSIQSGISSSNRASILLWINESS